MFAKLLLEGYDKVFDANKKYEISIYSTGPVSLPTF